MNAKSQERRRAREGMRRTHAKYGHARDRGPGTDSARADSRDDAFERRTWLTAQKIALDLDAKIDSPIGADFVRRRLAELALRTETELMRIPARICRAIAAESNADKVRILLEREHRAVLTRLADALENSTGAR